VTGRYAETVEARLEAIALFRAIGDRVAEGRELTRIVLPHVSLGSNADAEAAGRHAVDLLETLPPSEWCSTRRSSWPGRAATCSGSATSTPAGPRPPGCRAVRSERRPRHGPRIRSRSRSATRGSRASSRTGSGRRARSTPGRTGSRRRTGVASPARPRVRGGAYGAVPPGWRSRPRAGRARVGRQRRRRPRRGCRRRGTRRDGRPGRRRPPRAARARRAPGDDCHDVEQVPGRSPQRRGARQHGIAHRLGHRVAADREDLGDVEGVPLGQAVDRVAVCAVRSCELPHGLERESWHGQPRDARSGGELAEHRSHGWSLSSSSSR
jgi:hypothetical protein